MNDAQQGPMVVPAHETQLAYIALSQDGALMATASEKGTLIRIFDSVSGKKVHEFRRGADRATIQCINFNAESTRLCVSSDKGTVHVFLLADSTRRGSSFDLLPKYFNSQWSVAKFTVNCPNSICAFASDGQTVVAFSYDGMCHKAMFKEKELENVETTKFT